MNFNNFNGPRLPTHTPKAKQRATRIRKNRSFTYRGFTFYVNTDQGVSKIHCIDPVTGQMQHQATVPSEVTMQACQELAKMGISWKVLEDLSIPRSDQPKKKPTIREEGGPWEEDSTN